MLFSQISKAQIFSKFDLMSGFWQLIFQKAMTQIFEPILHTTLIYIDDILLFSSNKQEHETLLHQFLNIVQSHGIMLSEKKSSIGQTNIEVLGMKIIDGKYRPGQRHCQGIAKVFGKNLSIKEIQQFLRIVNYIVDFIRIAPIC
ncbi:hypothetical protein DH2020_003879 [Rehmannia glutinosa]|uniref:Reverse transcriptase domain-containing protein n=1 Tax=Rehmannia glutinosa TaxID=99300 RepID=A0ABR0XN78_REHGL